MRKLSRAIFLMLATSLAMSLTAVEAQEASAASLVKMGEYLSLNSCDRDRDRQDYGEWYDIRCTGGHGGTHPWWMLGRHRPQP